MKEIRLYTALIMVLASPWNALSQCNQLRPQRDIQFNTDQDCAPSTVTNFTIRYFFNAPQVPADVVIHFEWNDPGGNATDIDIFSGLIVAAEIPNSRPLEHLLTR